MEKQNFFLASSERVSRRIFSVAAFLCLFAVLSICSCVIAEWDGNASEAFAGGSGELENPYLISNASELKYFEECINSPEKNKDYASLYYKLTDDIDLCGVTWTPIGTGVYIAPSPEAVYPFLGRFDGDGHVVKNYTVTGRRLITWDTFVIQTCSVNGVTYDMYTTTGEPIYKQKTDALGNPMTDENDKPIYETKTRTTYTASGLFGYNGGLIKNLCIENGNVSTEWGSAVGGILCGENVKIVRYVGVYKNDEYLRTKSMEVINSGVIENCHVLSGSIYSGPNAQGSGTGGNGNFTMIGGLIGCNKSGKISSSSANASVVGENIGNDAYFGGFVGRTDGANTPKSEITGCMSTSDVNVTAIKKSTIMQYAGGFVGSLDGVLAYCYAIGDVSISGGGSQSLIGAGGLIGHCANSPTVSQCFSTGDALAICPFDIVSSYARAGLLSGSGKPGSLKYCFALGNASVESLYTENAMVSGTVGNSDNTKFSTCYYSKESEFSINGESVSSTSGICSDVLIFDGGEDISFSAYFKAATAEALAGSPWLYDSTIHSKIRFAANDFTVTSLGEYSKYTGTSSFAVIPYGTLSVSANAFSDAPTMERIIVPMSVNTGDKKRLSETMPNATILFNSAIQDNYLEIISNHFDGDFLMNSSGSALVYVGEQGAKTSLPEGTLQMSTLPYVFSINKPSCIHIPQTFKAAYLGYVGESDALLHFSQYCGDFIDSCLDNDIPFSITGDLNGDGTLTLSDLSLLMKALSGSVTGGLTCDCFLDVCPDGKTDLSDLERFVKYFAGANVLVGE